MKKSNTQVHDKPQWRVIGAFVNNKKGIRNPVTGPLKFIDDITEYLVNILHISEDNNLVWSYEHTVDIKSNEEDFKLAGGQYVDLTANSMRAMYAEARELAIKKRVWTTKKALEKAAGKYGNIKAAPDKAKNDYLSAYMAFIDGKENQKELFDKALEGVGYSHTARTEQEVDQDLQALVGNAKQSIINWRCQNDPDFKKQYETLQAEKAALSNPSAQGGIIPYEPTKDDIYQMISQMKGAGISTLFPSQRYANAVMRQYNKDEETIDNGESLENIRETRDITGVICNLIKKYGAGSQMILEEYAEPGEVEGDYYELKLRLTFKKGIQIKGTYCYIINTFTFTPFPSEEGDDSQQ